MNEMNDFLQSLRNGQADKQRPPKTRKSYDNSYQYSSPPRYHSYGNGYQNHRNPNLKRQPISPRPMGNQLPPEDPGITLLADAIENLTNHVEIMVKHQEYLTTVMERQAFAIERIISHLRMEAELQHAPEPVPNTRYDTMEEEAKAEEDCSGPVMGNMEEPRGRLFSETPTAPAEPEPKTRRRVIRKRRKLAAEAKNPQPSALLPREEIMEIIDTMRGDGATYDQIAKHLVELEQPTFSGRGEWHAQTIHRLCGRK